LLDDIGAAARLDGAILRDEIEYGAAPTFPIATNVTAHPYTTNVTELTLNTGTAIEPNGADTLVSSSSFAYLDRTQSGNLTDDDELGSHPVVTVEAIGEGEVVTVSDPSIFINTMLAEPDNEAFATALISSHDRVVFDYSHRGLNSPVVAGIVWLRQIPLLQGLVGLLGVGLIIAWQRRDRGPDSVGPQLAERLLARIPPSMAHTIRSLARAPAPAQTAPRDGTETDAEHPAEQPMADNLGEATNGTRNE